MSAYIPELLIVYLSTCLSVIDFRWDLTVCLLICLCNFLSTCLSDFSFVYLSSCPLRNKCLPVFFFECLPTFCLSAYPSRYRCTSLTASLDLDIILVTFPSTLAFVYVPGRLHTCLSVYLSAWLHATLIIITRSVMTHYITHPKMGESSNSHPKSRPAQISWRILVVCLHVRVGRTHVHAQPTQPLFRKRPFMLISVSHLNMMRLKKFSRFLNAPGPSVNTHLLAGRSLWRCSGVALALLWRCSGVALALIKLGDLIFFSRTARGRGAK